MKKRLTYGVLALVSIAFLAGGAISVAWKSKNAMKSQKEAQGFTLTFTHTYAERGNAPRLTGERVGYVSVSGEQKILEFGFSATGEKRIAKIVYGVPGLGEFIEDTARHVLEFYRPAGSAGKADGKGGIAPPQKIEDLKKSPQFVRTEMVLGQECAVLRSSQGDNDWVEWYHSPLFGVAPAKMVSHTEEGESVMELTGIVRGEPAASLVKMPDDWPVSFSGQRAEAEKLRSFGKEDRAQWLEAHAEKARSKLLAQGRQVLP
jgi:hypothetical protein